jgi:hypothetical protein
MADADPIDPIYTETARDLIGELVIGRTIVGVTQHDRDEFIDGELSRVEFHLDNGAMVTLYQNGDITIEQADGKFRTIGLTSDDDEEDDATEKT